jgi:hypothetical protein
MMSLLEMTVLLENLANLINLIKIMVQTMMSLLVAFRAFARGNGKHCPYISPLFLCSFYKTNFT